MGHYSSVCFDWEFRYAEQRGMGKTRSELDRRKILSDMQAFLEQRSKFSPKPVGQIKPPHRYLTDLGCKDHINNPSRVHSHK